MRKLTIVIMVLIGNVKRCLRSCKEFNRDLDTINKFVVSEL